MAISMAACSKEAETQPAEPVKEGRTRVGIMSRSNEPSAQDAQLQAGLFMVNYVNGYADELLPEGNYVHNQLLTWTGSGWTTATPIYWNDMDTPADFYAYAPYQATVADARAMPFAVETNQRTDAAFARSDLMWGSVAGQMPTSEGFDLTLSHQLSKLMVAVTAEAGFDENELQSSDVIVTIGGTRTRGKVDLATGDVSPLTHIASTVYVTF